MRRVYEPTVRSTDLAAVHRALLRGDLALGPELAALESLAAQRSGAREGVAVANGTVALDLVFAALGLGVGDEVIVPSLTIISCAGAIVRAGATPVVADVDPETWTLTPLDVERAAGPRTRAVLAVHLFGHVCDPAIAALCRERGWAYIEDCAQAHGAEVLFEGTWRPAGSLGLAATMSFYANKSVTCGEGGMVVTSDAAVADRVRSLRNLCFVKERRFLHHELGTNARLSNVAAALALAQLQRLDDTLRRKRAIAAAYDARLEHVTGVSRQRSAGWTRFAPWMVALSLDGRPAAPIIEQLAARGVESRPFFVGLERQPCLRGSLRAVPCPTSARLAETGLYLPSAPALTSEAIDEVVSTLEEVLRGPSRATSSRRAESCPVVFGTPYAGLYDAFYATKSTASEARAIAAHVQRFGRDGAGRRALDIGCGTGRHMVELAKHGFEVAGCDPSHAMLERARARGLSEVRCASAANVRFESLFDVVTANFAVLSYMVDDDELRRSLANIRDHLQLGGLLIADVWYGPGVLAQPPEARTLEVEVDGIAYTRHAHPLHVPERQVVEVHYRVCRGDDEVLREVHAMRYFFRRELELVLSQVGLELIALGATPDLGPIAAGTYSASFVARAS